jgi:hypothetical protein
MADGAVVLLHAFQLGAEGIGHKLTARNCEPVLRASRDFTSTAGDAGPLPPPGPKTSAAPS